VTTKQKTVAINKFLGLNLKNDPMGLKKGELVAADNIDIDDNFKPRTRRGFSNVYAGKIRSLHGNDNLMLFVTGVQLYSYAPVPVLIRSNMHSFNPCAFVDVGDETYYCDGLVNGKFVGEEHVSWAVEEPGGLAQMSAVSGSLYEGCYHINITYLHQDGRESGCGSSLKIDVPAGSGIKLTNIAQPGSSDISKISVYCTEANGSTLYRRAELDVGTTAYTINSKRTDVDLMTQFKRPPPIGEHLAFSGSRVFVATDNFLFASLPFTYHLFDLTKDYWVFPAPITMLAQHQTGVFVSADKLYFLSTVNDEWPLRTISKYKAITGTVTYIDGQEFEEEIDELLPLWVSQNGVLVGLPNGKVKNLTEGKIDIGESTSGASIVRKESGLSQIVTSVKPGAHDSLYFGDSVVAEIRRGGVIIP